MSLKPDDIRSVNKARCYRTRVKSLGSNNKYNDSSTESDFRIVSALRPCQGCGRSFVPTGPQRYCSHECYSGTLREPIETRFWRYVNKTPSCWLWTGGLHTDGYGILSVKRRPAGAHRVSWELHHGPIPDGLSILHKCDVPACCNPAHLFLGTQQDNLADARRKGRLDNSGARATPQLTPEQRLAIYELPSRRGLVVELARQYGVTKSCISVIRHGRFVRPIPTAQRALDAVLEAVPFRVVEIRGQVA